MTKPKIAVFDLGKVLVDFDYSVATANLARQSNTSAADVHYVLFETPLLFRYEIGELTTQQFFDDFVRKTGFHGKLDQFSRHFAAIFSEIPPMVALHQRLAAAGVPTYIFSNTNPLAVHYIHESFPFYRRFNAYVYSFEVKFMKPQPGIYEALEKRSGCRGAEVLYLDDRPENVAAGAHRGWQAFVHRSPEETVPAIEKLMG